MQFSRRTIRDFARQNLNEADNHDSVCPLFQKCFRGCQAWDAAMVARRHRCRSDDHDSCPTYLGYLLRRTRPLRADNDWHDVD